MSQQNGWRKTMMSVDKILMLIEREEQDILGNPRALTPDEMEQGLNAGHIIPVGKFFWIVGHDIIGHDSDARHGHNTMDGGSVDIDCTLTIRGIEDGYAIVRLNRSEMPYGALAAIGTVFQIPLMQIAMWPEMIRQREKRDAKRQALAEKYCR